MVIIFLLLGFVGGFFAAAQYGWRAGGFTGLVCGTLLGLVGAVLGFFAVIAAVGFLVFYLFLHDRYAPGYRRPEHRKLLCIRTLALVVAVVAFWLWLGKIVFTVFDESGKRRDALLMAVGLPGGLLVVFVAPWFAPMFESSATRQLPSERNNLGLHLRTPSGELRRPRKPAAGDGDADRTLPP